MAETKTDTSIFDTIQQGLTIGGINFSVGTGYSFLKMKAATYLKVKLLDITKKVDFGLIADSLGEIGAAAGIDVSKSDSKIKMRLDAGLITDIRNKTDPSKIRFGAFGGLRIRF